MNKKKATLKYMPNTFEIIEEGDYVLCAISEKQILLENLNYWNVELQEAYYSPIEAQIKNEELNKKK
jgi:hypothetical protein|tara:strand:- start:309 stop:509 length:201 start_codon:yes stop_codon:yes gene_type:complete